MLHEATSSYISFLLDRNVCRRGAELCTLCVDIDNSIVESISYAIDKFKCGITSSLIPRSTPIHYQ